MTAGRVHRYAAVLPAVRGKRVLVVGERDAALVATLGGAARDVESVVPDPFASSLRLEYADSSFDVVVALSGLERIADPGGLVREARRVLSADGVLCIAFPAAVAAGWRLDGVRRLLEAEFPAVVLHGQREIVGSLLYPLGDGARDDSAWYVYDGANISTEMGTAGAPVAYVAVCSTSSPRNARPSVLVDASAGAEHAFARRGAAAPDGEALRRQRSETALRERHFANVGAALEQARAEVAAAVHAHAERERALDAMRAAHHASAERSSLLEKRDALHVRRLRDRETELNAARALIDALERELAERTAAASALESELAQVRDELDRVAETARRDGAALRELLASRSWRLTRTFRVLGGALRPNGVQRS